MASASEPGVIAGGAGALPGARRRCEAGKRTHGPGPRACLALLAATALLALAAPAQAQTEIWSATLTPVNVGGGILGCLDVPTAQCSSTAIGIVKLPTSARFSPWALSARVSVSRHT